MLTLTENASTIISGIADQMPEAAGIRITSGEAEQTFEVAPAQTAEPGDQVVEQDGATVFLNDAASTMLDDKILDAGVDESGNVQFALGAQEG